MKIWLAVHEEYGICPAMSRGNTKREIEEHIRYAAGQQYSGRYWVQRFEIKLVKRKKRKVKQRKVKP